MESQHAFTDDRPTRRAPWNTADRKAAPATSRCPTWRSTASCAGCDVVAQRSRQRFQRRRRRRSMPAAPRQLMALSVIRPTEAFGPLRPSEGFSGRHPVSGPPYRPGYTEADLSAGAPPCGSVHALIDFARGSSPRRRDCHNILILLHFIWRPGLNITANPYVIEIAL